MNGRKAAQKHLSFIERVAFTANWVVAISLVVSYLATYIAPEKFWPPAFFGLAYPVLLILNLFFLVYWVILWKRWFLISLTVVLAGYRFLADTISVNGLIETPVTAASVEASRRHLRVMTYNVHFFRRFDAALNAPVKEAMLELIKEESPDVFFVQEFFTRRRGDYALGDSVKKILHAHYLAYHACDSNKFESVGIAIFSRYPISHVMFVPLATERRSVNGVIFCNIALPGKIARAFCIQLQSINFQAQDYEFLDRLGMALEPEMESYRHIGGKLKLAFVKRSRQAQVVAKLIAESPYPVILGGDFNDPPVSFAFHTLTRTLRNCFTQKGTGFASTYHGAFPNFQIDYLLCDSVFKVENYQIIKKDLSDHYPVRSDLSF